MSTVIIDYGMGNVASVQKALNFLKIENTISKQVEDIRNAKFIVLPGVGSFAQGMEHLKQNQLDAILTQEVLVNKKPFLGICLGMQLIATTGNEPFPSQGLSWIDGEVLKIEESNRRIPHLGWNQINANPESILADFDQKDFYFIHSFHFKAKNIEDIAATVNYGNEYVAAIQSNNIFATQFHPEKSQEFGLKLMSKFFTENA